ncbi:unnamed protein product [Agarophyton chilense]
MLLHVVDVSDEQGVMQRNMEAGEGGVKDIGAGGKPTMIVLNKVDLMAEDEMERLKGEIEMGIELYVEVFIPYNCGHQTTAIYLQSSVDADEFVKDGMLIQARVPVALCRRLRRYMVGGNPEV